MKRHLLIPVLALLVVTGTAVAAPQQPLNLLENGAGNSTTTPSGLESAKGIQKQISLEITNVQSTSTTASSSQIKWTTNKESDSRVTYWIGTSIPSIPSSTLEAYDASTTKNHFISLEELEDGQTYSFFVTSEDMYGNSASSSVRQFQTQVELSTAGRAYIISRESKIWSIDTLTDGVIASTSYSGAGSVFIAVSKENNKAYVSNQTDSSVSVIDLDTLNEDATIPIGGGATVGLVASPDGSKLYVGANTNRILTIDTNSNSIVHSTTTEGRNPFSLDISPDGSKLYVVYRYNEPCCSFGSVRVFDTATMSVIANIPSGYDPLGIEISNDGSKAYVVGSGDRLYVIDTSTNNLVTSVGVDNDPWGIAISPDDSRVYVANRRYSLAECCSGSISIVDTSDNTLVKTVKLGVHNGPWNKPQGLSVSPDGKKLYIVMRGDSEEVFVMDTDTYEIIERINLGPNLTSFGEFIVSD